MINRTILSILFIFSCSLSGCTEQSKQHCTVVKDGWIYNATLDEFFMDFECLKVKKFVVCTPDDDNPNRWPTLFEISDPEKVKKVFEVLRVAKRGYMPAWQERMKIITESKKFIMLCGWDNESVYGDHWQSEELRALLRQWGYLQ